ncbi:hypothetical protein Ae263Ps1_2431c [Pseudonocardia sp. Ae263_Ps1]|uniref:GNAT family N-acetyltransferase n=1 Tax=unclassified Pseudonocardia TaxID=2619320 RepID=UPI00094B2463|nr:MULTISPECIES: GNAT family protein [unclassified Pseudonocardia]OLL74517.1 hypothetical protein Ae150APs1_2895 [Pseudonocardia sp. Ae150A_Ps1]OLL85376.1 hypothetical protein Ae263Ps1_2431c [Pseudonocardia sp. Ae263_Ps1]OLL94597.1 hypothetical protein Ae356Ps1_4494 [Pseudonocardia sp. Ae356_Ps1]
MLGRLVALEAPTECDFITVAEWLAPTSAVAVLTGDSRERVTADGLSAAHRDGSIDFWMVRPLTGTDGDRRHVGVVNSRRVGGAGTFTIGGAVADPGRWSQGLGAEAFGLLVDHLFLQQCAHRVQFQTALYNRGMIEMLTRGGFVLEGILRDHHFLDGDYHDATIWSILRAEFESHTADPRNRALYPVTESVEADDKRRAVKAMTDYLDRAAGARAVTSWNSFVTRSESRRAV